LIYGVSIDMHKPGGNWAFYVIVPMMFSGTLASLWLIVKGAMGLFGHTGAKAPRRRE
jgi:hypothetical protein